MQECKLAFLHVAACVSIFGVMGCVEEEPVDQLKENEGLQKTEFAINTQSSSPKGASHRVKAENSPSVLDPGELVYEHRIHRDANGKLSKVHENGDLTQEDVRLVARPYGMQALQKGVLYHEGSYSRSDDNSSAPYIEHYEVRKENVLPVNVERYRGVKVSKNLQLALLDNTLNDIEIIIGLKGFRDWNVNMLPSRNFVSVQDWIDAKRIRDEQIFHRIEGFKNARDKILPILAQKGVTKVVEYIESGMIVASVNPRDIASLNLDEVSLIDLSSTAEQTGCSTASSCGLSPTSAWRVGQGRSADRLFVEPFHQAGYDGGQLNSSRQGSGGIVVGLIDYGLTNGNGWEDEFLGFNTSSNSTNPAYNRIWKRYNCASGACSAITNYSDSGTDGGHAAVSLGIMAGNFQNFQAEDERYDDVCFVYPTWYNGWDGKHCAAWTRASSGMAPWARVAMYPASGGFQSNVIAGLNRAMTDNVDIINKPMTGSATSADFCSLLSPTAWEIASENAFDDGIFVVNSSGNGPTSGSSCTVRSPGDMPKVFTVNALDSSTSACRNDYSNCPLADFGVVGGVDAPLFNGTTISGAISAVDIVAPGSITYTGNANETTSNDIGAIFRSYKFGTSYAAPHVAGSAAVIKDWFIANGNTWINSPGRLTAVMLGMADRGNINGQLTKGVDSKWGTGRLKLRRWGTSTGGLAGQWGRGNWTHTLNSSSSNIKKFPFGAQPLPASASFLKCVMYEAEDMSSKSTVGDLYFQVSTSNPVNGQCLSNSSTIASTFDSSYDLKHMVSMEGQSNLGGKCVNYHVYKGGVAGSSIMVNTFCYYSEVEDNEPN